MGHDPYRNVGTRVTSQRERTPGRSDEVQNNAGGFVFAIDDWARLRRFLVLGTQGGTYYQTEQALTKENADVVVRLAQSDGVRLVDELIKVSEENIAPRVQPTLFALAIAASLGDDATRHHALHAGMSRIVRTGYHLFKFKDYLSQFRGMGRGVRDALNRWYLDKTPDDLAFQVVKYGQREGWSHRDILRQTKPVVLDPAHNAVLGYATGRPWENLRGIGGVPAILEGTERVKTETDPARIAELITTYNLPWEVLPDHALKEHATWEALVPRMGLTALIRNLNRMTANGVLKPLSDMENVVLKRLGDKDGLLRSKVHPFAVLIAMTTYAAGHGIKGSMKWTPVRSVVDALDAAFYLAFDNVTPSGKNTMVALDISGSMTWSTIMNTHITPREASAAMALITLNAEPRTMVTAFTSRMGGSDPWGSGIKEVSISPRQRIDDVVRTTQQMQAGATDCALPMLYATEHGLTIDTFVIYTDNESWSGAVKPFQALLEYRQKSGRAAKFVAVGMTPTGFSVSDPTDPGSMDVVGFDASAPQIISDFAADRI